MNKVEGAIKELNTLQAHGVASILSAMLLLNEAPCTTLRALDNMRRAETQLNGALKPLLDLKELGEGTPRTAAIDVFITIALEGINEMRQEIGKEKAA